MIDISMEDRIIIAKALLFFFSGFLSMLYAYYRKKSHDDLPGTFLSYVTRDWNANGRALTTLIAMLAGAAGLDYLSALSFQQIIMAGAGIGLIVPDRVGKA